MGMAFHIKKLVPGLSLFLRKGDVLKVDLENAASAGFLWTWEVSGHGAVERGLEESRLSGNPSLLCSVPPSSIGGFPVQTVSFNVVSKGAFRLAFKQSRHWEPEEKAKQVFLMVTVSA